MGQENNQNNERGPEQRGPDWKKRIISIISDWIHDTCGENQLVVLIIVAVIFFIFVGAVIYKNFWGDTNIVIELCNKQYVIGHINTDFWSKVILSFVEIATLPILILTLMFSAHGGFQSSKQDDLVNTELTGMNNDLKKTNEDIERNNKDIKQNNKDIHEISKSLQQFKEDILSEVKNMILDKSLESPVNPIEGSSNINEDKIGDINPDK